MLGKLWFNIGACNIRRKGECDRERCVKENRERRLSCRTQDSTYGHTCRVDKQLEMSIRTKRKMRRMYRTCDRVRTYVRCSQLPAAHLCVNKFYYLSSVPASAFSENARSPIPKWWIPTCVSQMDDQIATRRTANNVKTYSLCFLMMELDLYESSIDCVN